MMQQIAASMKEVPVLPSENPGRDVHPLKRVEMTPNGVLTYMEGYEHPYRGFPLAETVEKIDILKKVARRTQSAVYHAFKKRSKAILLLLALIPARKDLFWAYTYSFHEVIKRFRLKVESYSPAVQELHRAASVDYPEEDERTKELRLMLRDIECMILEFDNAYRFRMQDLIEHLDQQALLKNPIKELNRILNIFIDKEKTEEIKDSWRLLKGYVNWYLRFDRKTLWMIVRIVAGINISKFKLSIEDKQWCIGRKDYRFTFMEQPSEEDAKLIEKIKRQEAYDIVRGQVDSVFEAQLKAVFDRHNQEQMALTTPELLKVMHENQGKALAQLAQEFEENKKKTLLSFLNKEQVELLERQEKEIIALYQEQDKKNKVLAEQHVST